MSGRVVELPRFEGRWLRLIAIGAVVVWFLLSSFYTVDADEVGVIQRFGKYVETMQPGLHMKIPFGIETVKRVKVQRVLKEEFGYRTQAPGVRSTYAEGDYSAESLMLTGDLSCALVEWIVQYRIKDPRAYLFHVRDITGTIRDLTESAMRQVVGDHSVDEVIITNRQEISLEVRDLLQQLLDHTETGVDIVTVNLQDVNPPGPVQPAFNAVNEAKQERERIINEALEAYNKVIPQAQGEAEQLLRQAEGYSVNRINRARGDADKFLAIWQEYSRARDVTRRRLYLETMLEVMPRIKEVYIIDDKQGNLIPLLQMRGQEKGDRP
ncbi:MAG: FtsH protease activity modulator HflK [candidate division KSB1 bacterium]|nr:FtsH protease activity modulator HflK [candidate division KSB1 bacterium]